MHEDKLENQIPVLRFLIKHKWRIIIPVLFATFYFALPRYFNDYVAVQQRIFIKSSVLDKNELDREVSNIRDYVLSDDFLQHLILKYDLYKNENSNSVGEKILLGKLRKSVNIWLDDNKFATDTSGFSIWINLKKENAQNIAALSNEVTAQFENSRRLQVNKHVSEPYDSDPYKSFILFADIALRGLLLFSIPLILIWEIPYLFYSPKTKEMIFNPLKSDWQNELLEAKLKNQTWKAMQINIRYSYAFLAAMIQKSPIGDFMEFISKPAK